MAKGPRTPERTGCKATAGAVRNKNQSPPKSCLQFWLLPALLAVAIAVVYAPVRHYQFVDFDDDLYVLNNAHVNGGVTLAALKWAFTNLTVFYWQPLTWLSHMADCQLFGLNAGPAHVENVLIHIANCLLLFVVLERLTKSRARSFAAAALFGLHPLRVESVAWIAERKDVLSAFCLLLTILLYAWYAQRTSRLRYTAVITVFVLGLMAKPSVIALPLVLLALDFWPLRRVLTTSRGALIREKLPLLGLSIASGLITLTGLQEAHTTAALPLGERLLNGTSAYLLCLAKLFWPSHLAVLYPYPAHSSVMLAVASASVLVAMITAGWHLRKRYPYVLTGTVWFVAVLTPAAGFIQSGAQRFADRFSYLACIGILVLVVWGAADAARRWKLPARVVQLAAAASVCICVYVTAQQIPAWQDSITLFSQAAAIEPPNSLIEHNLGYGLALAGRYADAIPHYRRALELDPEQFRAHYNLGRALFETGHAAEAVQQFTSALASPVDDWYRADILNALGIALTVQGDYANAERSFHEALRIAPDSPALLTNSGSFFARTGRIQQAIESFRAAIARNGSFTEAHLNLARALGATGDSDGAMREYKTVLDEAPGNTEARAALQTLAARAGR